MTTSKVVGPEIRLQTYRRSGFGGLHDHCEIDLLDHLSETSNFEGLPAMDTSALRLELMRDPSFSAPTSWSLFESAAGVWQVRRIWIDTRNSLRNEPFRFGSDAKLEPGLADAILRQLEALVLPAFAAPGMGLDGTWRAVRRPGTRSRRLDVALNWWEEPPGFSSANQWFDWSRFHLIRLGDNQS